jgi:hypothetical protein
VSSLEEGRARAIAFVGDPRKRRRAYLVIALILALLCVFPRPYTARAKILPEDPSEAGASSMLSALGGQLGVLASLVNGNTRTIDVYLIIGRSDAVQDDVIKHLQLVGPGAPYTSMESAKRGLDRKVDVHSLLGGVLEIETLTHDPEESMRITRAYVAAISQRIEALGRVKVGQREKLIEGRFKDASDRAAVAAARLDAFRRANRLVNPEAQLGAALALRTSLQARLDAKQVELKTVERFTGEENVRRLAIQSEIASLRAQIAETARAATDAAGPNVTGLSEISTQYLNLYRDNQFAQALYGIYYSNLEQVTVQALSTENLANVEMLEPPHLDVQRGFNISAVALLAALVLLAMVTEVYAPATGLKLFSRRADPAE